MTTDLAKLPRVLAVVFATTIVLVEILVLSSVRHPAGRARAIVLALMLSRWTMLPVAYGLRVTDENGLGARWRGGVTFTEFSLSSIFALAVAMGLYDVIGLAAIIVSVILILLCRLFFSRVAGGISGYSMAASGQLCELLIFAVVATFRF